MNSDTYHPLNARTPSQPPPRLPPPLPSPDHGGDLLDAPDLSSFSEDYQPVEDGLTPFRVADSLIKHPARAVYEMIQGRSGTMLAQVFLLTLICGLGYGLVMGSFAGGAQFWMVPCKLTVGLLLSGLLCLPSLYILISLSGSDRSFRETLGLLLEAMTLAMILLVGFAPVAWLFSQATATTPFMGILHLAFWGIAIAFSLRFLKTALRHLSRSNVSIVTVWGIIFFAVLLQMSTTLRPLLGKDYGLIVKEKKFFVTHWVDCFENPRP